MNSDIDITGRCTLMPWSPAVPSNQFMEDLDIDWARINLFLTLRLIQVLSFPQYMLVSRPVITAGTQESHGGVGLLQSDSRNTE